MSPYMKATPPYEPGAGPWVAADVRQYVTGLVEDSNAASREHYRPRGGTGREG